jgi:hypothetical protein
MATYRRVHTSSLDSSYREDFEYLLMWISPFGGVRQAAFTHTNNDREDSYSYTVIDGKNDFRNVPNTITPDIDLVTDNLSREEFDYISSIFESNRVKIVSKDSEVTFAAISQGRKRTPSTHKGYEIKLKLKLQEPPIMNV